MASKSMTPSFKSKIYGLPNEIVEKITSSSPNIDSITVENSADVTIGNRTNFNLPTMPQNLSVGKTLDRSAMNQSELSDRNFFCRSNQILIYCICTALAVIITALVLAIYLSKVSGAQSSTQSSMCEEIPSDPSYLTCGFEPSCAVCGTLFPDNEICQSYYAADCGEVHCFCKPYCSSQDCLFSDDSRIAINSSQSFVFT